MKLTLLDFAYSQRDPNTYSQNTCTVYTVIKESVANSDTVVSKTVCGGAIRERLVYESQQNELELRLIRKEQMESVSMYYLLKYEGD